MGGSKGVTAAGPVPEKARAWRPVEFYHLGFFGFINREFPIGLSDLVGHSAIVVAFPQFHSAAAWMQGSKV
jgi:hypothetical protein